MSHDNKILIDARLVHRLITEQFPHWAHLTIKPVEFGGWDNRTFHLGEQMTVRLPSDIEYVPQVEKEQQWLPKLAPFLPLPIPIPLAMGRPTEYYPWHWSVYRWLEGKTASIERITDLTTFATALANFLIALQKIDITGGPLATPQNCYRGGQLKMYDEEARQAIALLKGKIDTDKITKMWDRALASTWQSTPVWVHGDVAPTNLLVKDGQLSAVIDFGSMAIGDPACDLVIAWTLLKGESRDIFLKTLQLDNDTWARARGWALWKALIICAELPGTNPLEKERSWKVINELLYDKMTHKNVKIIKEFS